MRSTTLRKPMTILAAAGLMTLPAAPMSDPVGVYAIVERVVLLPNASNPTSVQIFGRFAISDGQFGDHYRPTMKGYLHYRVNPSNERASRAEWADLKSIAEKKKPESGTVTIVGFGSKYERAGLGRVRCATEAPASPDLYPVGLGVVPMQSARNTGWPIAKELLDAPAPASACPKGS